MFNNDLFYVDEEEGPYSRFKSSRRARDVADGASQSKLSPAATSDMWIRRQVPTNREGVHDEWGALVALQNEAALQREQTERLQESQKKRQYLHELKATMANNRKTKDEAGARRRQEALHKLEEISRMEQTKAHEEQEQLMKKRQKLSEVNRKQMLEFRM